jgi:hypothetical protein
LDRVTGWLIFNGEATDPWGGVVKFDNPQEKGDFGNPLKNRAAHLIGTKVTKDREHRNVNFDKLDWLNATRTTIEDAQVRSVHGNETLYFRNYKEGTHMVVVENGLVKDQFALVTQYAPKLSETQYEGSVVEKIRR